MIDCVVSPELHTLPVTALEVKITDPPVQNVVGPLAVTFTVEEFPLTVTIAVAEDELP